MSTTEIAIRLVAGVLLTLSNAFFVVTELAMVEEDGRIVGLVTTTDAFEAIVGDLRDPFDQER